jgi:hypothetical protein
LTSAKLYGGLGNQLFIMAATIAHAKRVGDEYSIPTEVTNPHKKNQLAYSFTCVSKKAYDFAGIESGEPTDIEKAIVYTEPHFHYCPIPEVKNLLLDGYWQSPKYFDDFKDEFLELFELKIEKIYQGWCAVHVRRGDYVRFPDHHPVQKSVYYLGAMDFIYRKTGIRNFMIFSDDIAWCKDNFAFPRFEFGFREGYDEISDLIAMGSCAHTVMSNSSYSFWGQYINPNPDKIVVAPKKERWFGKDLSHHDVKDLYSDKWILM